MITCCRCGLRHSGTCQFVKGTPASYPMRLMIRWSPISRVFSMEPEGITRACPMVPLMSKNTSATQNQAMTSRCTRCPTGTLGCASFLGLGSAFMFHRHGMFDWPFTSVAVHRVTCFVHNAFAHFQLH